MALMRVLKTFRRVRELDGQRGQALVETAIVMPLLTLILLGVADFGWMAYQYIELANAANAGAHYAAQNVVTAANTALVKAAMNNDATNFSSINPTVSMACTCSDGTSGVTCTSYASCVPPARLIDTVTVTAQASVSSFVTVPGVPSSITMHSKASVQVEQ